jgi:hypothetical protein
VSVLTKIFVVLTTILALLLVPLMIAYVSNTAHFKDDAQSKSQQLTIAQQRAALLENEKSDLQSAMADAVAGKQQEIAQLTAQINTLIQNQRAQQIQLVELHDAVAGKDAAVDRLTAGQQQNAQIISLLEAEVQKRRSEAIESERKFIDLNDQVQDKTTQVNTLLEQVRLMKEQNTTLQQELVKATGGKGAAEPGQAAATAGGPTVTSVVPETPIRGVITAVQPVGSETFVSVNVGSNDQVSEGMQFIIHEGDVYIGSMTITKVDLNSSAGRITMARSEIKPNQEILASAY